MIRRPHRVTFRLSETERFELNQLRGYGFKWEDSEVIRYALKEMIKRKLAEESARRELSDTPAKSASSSAGGPASDKKVKVPDILKRRQSPVGRRSLSDKSFGRKKRQTAK